MKQIFTRTHALKSFFGLTFSLFLISKIFSQDTMLAQYNFEENEQGWTHQAYTDIGQFTTNPTGGWISTVNWPVEGGNAGSYRHNNAPNANGAWFMFSPNMVLEAGEQYYVKFGATLAGANTPQLNSRVQVRWRQTSDQPPYNLPTFIILMGSTYINTQGGVNGYVEFTSPVFTAPATGDYRIAVGDFFNANAWACYYDGIRIFKVGSTSEPCDFTITPSSASVCAGESVLLTASGQATAYTWSPAAGLSATSGATVTANTQNTTTYTVTGTNGACSSTQTVQVTVNPLPSIEVSASTSSICVGESITLTASGADTYTWLPAAGLSSTSGASVSASPATTTTYQVIGQTGNCSSNQSIQIIVNQNPIVSVSPPQATICAGSSVTLTASGADSFTWAPAAGLSTSSGSQTVATPNQTTTYTVEGVSNGCTASAQVEVVVSDVVPVQITPASGTVCDGDSLLVQVTGASEFSFSPTQGIVLLSGNTYAVFPSQTTTFTVSGSAGSCAVDNTITVTVEELPDAQFTYEQTVEYTVQFTNNTPGATSFLWNFGGGNTSTQANPSFTFPFDGNYPVTLITSNSCGSDTVTITVEVLKLSIDNLLAASILLFPNPSTDIIQINADGNIINGIAVFNSMGQMLMERQGINKQNTTLAIQDLAKGHYFIQLQTNKEIVRKPFIKM
ncbi:MAG: PKD domain-containing protein [Flavobacteriales bacterium]